MESVTQVNVATWDDSDTTLIDLPVADDVAAAVTITGKNQTLDYRSNYDQEFGEIEILGTDSESLDVTLENTARVDGGLSVEWLNIDDEDTDNKSAVRTVNLESAGARNTQNLVEQFNGDRVTTLNLTGTQDLAILVDTLATLPVTSGNTPDLTINGSTLGGDDALADLIVAVNAANLDGGDDDVITGTAGENDLLGVV